MRKRLEVSVNLLRRKDHIVLDYREVEDWVVGVSPRYTCFNWPCGRAPSQSTATDILRAVDAEITRSFRR